MALTVDIKLGDNTFHADGDFAVDESFVELFRAWINGQSETAEALDTLTERLRDNTDRLKSAVDEASPGQ